MTNGEQLSQKELKKHKVNRHLHPTDSLRPHPLVYGLQHHAPPQLIHLHLVLPRLPRSQRLQLLLLQTDPKMLGTATPTLSHLVLLRYPRPQLHRTVSRPLLQ